MDIILDKSSEIQKTGGRQKIIQGHKSTDQNNKISRPFTIDTKSQQKENRHGQQKCRQKSVE